MNKVDLFYLGPEVNVSNLKHIQDLKVCMFHLGAETNANFKEESDIREDSSKRKNSSKQPELALVAPISSLSTDTSASGNNNLATHGNNEGKILYLILNFSCN